MVRVVNLGEYIVTSHPDDTLRTYSLASCVGVVASCPVCSLMGMAHVVLPGKPPSRIANLEEQMKYAEVLVPAMLREMNGRHSCKEKGAPNVKLYGGIDSIFNCAFRIGERNLQSVKRDEHPVRCNQYRRKCISLSHRFRRHRPDYRSRRYLAQCGNRRTALMRSISTITRILYLASAILELAMKESHEQTACCL